MTKTTKKELIEIAKKAKVPTDEEFQAGERKIVEAELCRIPLKIRDKIIYEWKLKGGVYAKRAKIAEELLGRKIIL
mgnify:CR=1 FL=1